MKLEDISESPMLVLPLDFNLEDSKTNRESYMLTRTSRAEKLKSFGKYPLFKIGQKYIIVDEANEKVLYEMRYEIERLSILKIKSATQVKLWRNIGVLALSHASSDIFWNYLFPQTEVIATDRQQSQLGQAFWGNRINEAFRDHFFVYHFNHAIRLLKKFNSVRELHDNEHLIWGSHHKHEYDRVIISKMPISIPE